MMTLAEYYALVKREHDECVKHPCCKNCKYYYTECGTDLCMYWDECEENSDTQKCSKWKPCV